MGSCLQERFYGKIRNGRPFLLCFYTLQHTLFGSVFFRFLSGGRRRGGKLFFFVFRGWKGSDVSCMYSTYLALFGPRLYDLLLGKGDFFLLCCVVDGEGEGKVRQIEVEILRSHFVGDGG